MAVKKVQNAYYITGDMERAVAFYRDALGLTLAFQDGGKWAQMKAGAVGATVVIEVDDLAAAKAQLAAHGAEITGERQMGSGQALTFRDPDGNIVQLFQRPG